eukprot:CAMPEP_0168579112 /NCGR_PEP_ID=MMETSP0420-20121227/20_1 /TAXON_ID=498008 /ORGANISM="Pessonella sp." /LENGTH=143 /DNA_ID=CAMNT_0008613001 /DNA_START=41 /DNA_END=472 /DNA_ORIENTATION=-
MATGVGVSDDCVTKFGELKLGHKFRYIVFKMSDDLTEIVVEKTAPNSADYDAFKADLPKDDCRYAVYDFEYDQPGGGGKRSKILFVLWSPDTAKIKSKMLYTASLADLRKKLVGIGTEVQATDNSEIDYDEVLNKVTRGGTTA